MMLNLKLKEATEFYFMHYFCAIITLFIMDLYKSAFPTYSFKKRSFFVFCIFCLVWFELEVIFIDFLEHFCNNYFHRHQVLCEFVLT